MPQNPGYLYLRGSVWWFRSAIPSQLRATFGRSEIRLSLRTSSKRLARDRALVLRVELMKKLDINGQAMLDPHGLIGDIERQLGNYWESKAQALFDATKPPQDPPATILTPALAAPEKPSQRLSVTIQA